MSVAVKFEGSFPETFKKSFLKTLESSLLSPCAASLQNLEEMARGLLVLEGPESESDFASLQARISLLTQDKKDLCVVVAHRWNLLSDKLMPWLDSGAIALVHLDLDPKHSIDAFREVLLKKLVP